MSWKATLRRGARAALSALGTDPATAAARSGYFHPDDIGWICETYFTHGSAPGTPWDALRHAHMTLPSWFRHDIDPLSEAYAEQQHRLWQLISGVDRPYAPDVDEKEHDWGDIDPVRLPGYLARRDPLAVSSASDHVIATGMFLKHCGLKPGDWALEYGAGFGQTALALARLGVNVDTVDISTTFCEFVRRQAEFFQVPLSAFHGYFGVNPRPGQKYQMIWFYESFHHCLDFQNVVRQLGDHLAEGGRVILGGEPIVEREYAAVPYPWGVRLHSEVAAVVRKQHWFELGFSERFLFELFSAAGFVGRRIDCEPSLFGQLYVFERRPDEIDLSKHWLPAALGDHWQGQEPDGRKVKLESRLPLDARDSIAAIEVDLANPHWSGRRVEVAYGEALNHVELAAGQRKTVRIEAKSGVRELVFRSKLLLSAPLGNLLRPRVGGIMVRRLRYLSRN
jgi:SAM-dependent methyltransferase